MSLRKHKSIDFKLSAVKHYLTTDKTQEEICEIFGCSVRSLMRWVERYQDEGDIKRHNRESISYKITNQQIKFILNEIKKNKTITMEDLLAVTKEKFPDLDITRRHLNRIVKDNYISLKLTRYRHEPVKRFGKDININKLLKGFYDTIKEYDLDNIICIDETSINSLEKRGHCYSEVGKRCIIKSHSQDVFKKYTGIFAISSKGVLGWKLYDKGGIDTDRLLDFLEEILSRRKGKLAILDNASSHRNEKIKEYINLNNDLLYSIPYQHYTNGIENFFSILKSKLYKLNGYKYDDLKNNISKAIKDINITSYINILRGAYERDNYVKKSRKPVSRKTKKYKD